MTPDLTDTPRLLSALESGELTSRALVDFCLERIAAGNAELNAFTAVAADAARAQADAIDARRAAGEAVGRLNGLPVAVKDNICQRGLATTCGSRMLQEYRPPWDAHVIERIRAEDGVLIGRTNMDEFGMGSSSETSIFGSVRNPWNPQRTAGGSSGGSAAAVAADMVPLALGSDTGGSIRQPASFCGVVGLKPTYGRVSRYGLVAYASSLDQIGVFARDARGCELLLDVIAGHDPRDSTSLPDTQIPPLNAEEMRGQPLRIGIADEHFTAGLNAEVADCVRAAVDELRDAGAEVETVSLPHSKYSVAAYYLIACSEASSNLARFDGIHYGHRAEAFDDLTDLYCQSRGEGFGDEVKRRVLLGTFALSAGYYEAFYVKALRVRRRIREDLDRAFGTVDVVAGPVAPGPAFVLGTKLDDPLAMYLSDMYTLSANLAGLPALSIPCGSSTAGLPVGLQLMAPPLHESRLLEVMRLYQQRTDWHRRRPPAGGTAD